MGVEVGARVRAHFYYKNGQKSSSWREAQVPVLGGLRMTWHLFFIFDMFFRGFLGVVNMLVTFFEWVMTNKFTASEDVFLVFFTPVILCLCACRSAR